MNATDTNTLVQRALAGGYGLWVDTDAGDFDLFGADLEETWDSLAPGEAFKVLGVVLDEAGT
jgi:hypothetical protein